MRFFVIKWAIIVKYKMVVFINYTLLRHIKKKGEHEKESGDFLRLDMSRIASVSP